MIEKDSRVLIARRRKKDTLGGKWEFPGGKVEPGETPEKCLERELKEEFDIETKTGPLFLSTGFKYCLIPIELLVYRVKYIAGDFKINEHDEIRWAAINELDSYDFVSPDRPIVKALQGK